MPARDPAMLDAVRNAMAALPEPAGTVYRFHLVDGLDYPAIAERLGLSRADVERCIAEAIVLVDRAVRAGPRAERAPPRPR